MAYKLIVTNRANIHLEKLLSYLVYGFENGQAAIHLLDEIKNIYLRIQENPKQFPYCQDTNLKELFFWRFLRNSHEKIQCYIENKRLFFDAGQKFLQQMNLFRI